MMRKGIQLRQQDEAEDQSERDGIQMVEAGSIIRVSRMEKQKCNKRYCSSRRCIVFIVVVVALWIAGNLALQSNRNSNHQDKIAAEEHNQEKVEAQPQKTDEPKAQQQHAEQFPPQQVKPIAQTPVQPASPGSFQVQKLFWLYNANQHKDLLSKLYYENNQYFARKSGFKVQIVTQDNYHQFISKPQATRLQQLRQHLSSKMQPQECKNIVYYVSFLMILAENGGIMATEQYALTETFDWLRDIKNDLHAKRGLQAVDAEMFAFYDPEKSSPSVKENINVKHQTQKYMRIYPGLDPYFLAAKKNCRFLRDIISEILLLLTGQAKDQDKYMAFGTNLNRVYEHYFYIAGHRVLQQKQRELDVQFKDHKYRVLAVDHYSLYFTNHLGSLRKLFAMTGDHKSHVTFQVMSKQIAEEWAELFGPLRHLARLTPHDQMNDYLQQVIKGKKDPIVKGSFLQKTLYPEGSHSFIIDNPEKPFVNSSSEPWSALPRKIWVFWDTGIQNAPLIDQLCVELMRIRGKESGFELHILSNSNAHEFISAENLSRIQGALRNAQVQTFVQSKGDLVRLALLVEHGGVYFDVSYAPLTNLDWLANIGKYPSHHIYNRYGNLPKVIMHYHPQWGGVFQWKVDPNYNTKAQWNLPYENNFIAAEKGAPLIVDWFNKLLENYRLPYPQTSNWLKQQGLVDSWQSPYLMPMDTLMATIGKKQKEIKADPSSPYADATDYYKLWSINGYAGFQKFRDRTGFQSFLNADNTFVYRYSEQYVKAYLGLNFHLIKFYGQQNAHMSNFLNSHKPSNFSTGAHPQSIFMRYYTHKDVPYEPGSEVRIRH